MAMKFERFTFREKHYVEHEVEGRVFRFYPNRMALLAEAKDMAAPVADSLNKLFADESRDSESMVKRHREGDFYMEEIATKAVSSEMATFRQQQRGTAIEQLMNVVADERSKILIGRLLMDSLREEFPYRRDRSAEEVERFLYGEEGEDATYTGLDFPVLVGFIGGWIKANAKVFGTMGEKMVGLVRERLAAHLRGASPSEGLSPTSGDSSKMPLSPELATASEPTT